MVSLLYSVRAWNLHFIRPSRFMRPLPIYIPEVYELHARRVGVEGYVTLHTNQYSAPVTAIGRQVEIRESETQVRLFDGHTLVAEHARAQPGMRARSTLPEHVHRSRRNRVLPPSDEEKLLRTIAPEFGELIARLRKRHGGQALKAVKKAHKMYLDYDTSTLLSAIRRALDHDLCNLERIERMVLREIAGDFFRIEIESDDDCDDET